MAQKKKNDNIKITDQKIESFARCLLPAIENFFESGEGKREFHEWKEKQTQEHKEAE